MLGTSMPKAAVDKDGDARTGKDEISLATKASNRSDVLPVAQPTRVDCLS
jgi:hypothetical protein